MTGGVWIAGFCGAGDGVDRRLGEGDERRLVLLAVGDVDEDDAESDDLRIDSDRVDVVKPVVELARIDETVAAEFHVEYRLTRLEDLPTVRLELRPQCRRHLGEGAAEMLVHRGGAIERGHHLVDSDVPELPIEEEEPDRRGRQQCVEKGMSFIRLVVEVAAVLVGLFVVLDVGERADPPVDRAIGCQHR